MDKKMIIRDAQKKDFDDVIRIDAEISIAWYGTVIDKNAYWKELFDYYVLREKDKRFFLVAELNNEVAGFVIGEARAWEFGSPLCGWVFAVEVSSRKRTLGVGQQLFTEICHRLNQIGVSTIRTMVDIENKETLSFFRSQGMRTGRNIELEIQI
jgi:ribosomal protein S18 acetylase RimI-like enzyme